MDTLASGLSRMASVKMSGRNLAKIMRTRGPFSLSASILPKSAAVASRTCGDVELQKRSSR